MMTNNKSDSQSSETILMKMYPYDDDVILIIVCFSVHLAADPSPPEPPINIRVSNQTLDWTGSQPGSQLTDRYLNR